LQPPYSLLRRDVETDVLPYCAKHGIGVVAYSPMASGLLSGKMTRERVASLPANDWRKTRSLEFQEPALTRNLAVAERVRVVAESLGRGVAETAIAWTLRHPAVSAAIVGARRPEQLDDLIGAPDVDSVALAGLDEPGVIEHRDEHERG
jgi:aryl-alcohol dehydrogenase-like predicted oxidoreductase